MNIEQFLLGLPAENLFKCHHDSLYYKFIEIHVGSAILLNLNKGTYMVMPLEYFVEAFTYISQEEKLAA